MSNQKTHDSRRYSSVSTTFCMVAFALLGQASCDSDKSVNNGRDAGSGGSTGSGGSVGSGDAGSGGTPGSGGTAVGTGGTPAAGGTAGIAASGGAPGAGGNSGGRGGAGGISAGGAGGATVADTDIVVARFNTDGTLDSEFGTNGVVRVNLGPGVGTTRDALWNVARDAGDRLVLFGSRKAEGARSDADRVVVRLTPNGAIDTTFATMGVHTLNVGNLGDNARSGTVQTDGKIFSAGYASQPTGVGTQTANRPVLLRLLDNGMPDATFGAAGIVNYSPFMSTSPTVLWGFAEAYGAGILSTGAYVTTGYGRSDPALTTVNLISIKFSAAGVPDPTFGVGGAFEKDIAGDNDRGRGLVVLPGDRILMVGSATPAPMNIDAMLMMVTPGGALDTTFNTTGFKLYKFDDRPDEAFFAGALSPNNMLAAAVGYRAGGVGNNDDATLVLLPLAGSAAEFAQAVPVSATTNDRFWGVTFDAINRPIAAGFVTEGGDNAMTAVRFNPDGTRDTTFGMGGLAKVNASVAGTLEEARGVVVLSTGKIVIAGVAEHQ